MLRRLRPRLTYANVMVTVLMFIVLGGAAYAANEWTGANIVDESLTGADVQNGSLNAQDIAQNSIGTLRITDGSLGSNDITDSSLDGRDIRDSGLTGADIQDGTIHGDDVAEVTLDPDKESVARTVETTQPCTVTSPYEPIGCAHQTWPALPPRRGKFLLIFSAEWYTAPGGGTAFCTLWPSTARGPAASFMEFGEAVNTTDSTHPNSASDSVVVTNLESVFGDDIRCEAINGQVTIRHAKVQIIGPFGTT